MEAVTGNEENRPSEKAEVAEEDHPTSGATDENSDSAKTTTNEDDSDPIPKGEVGKLRGPSKEDFLAFKKPIIMSDARTKLVKNVFDEPKAPAPKVAKKLKPKAEKLEPEADDTKPEVAAPAQSEPSPAQLQKMQEEAFPYKEPPWGTVPADNTYAFEVLKNGTIIGTVELNRKSFYSFGRLPSCDVKIEHPSSSRHHAVVQYCGTKTDDREPGWYLYDLDSTHGTWVNKTKVKPRVYERIRVGHVAKFGGSSRLYILTGPDSDQDEEKQMRVDKELLVLHERKAELLRQAAADKKEQEDKILSEDTSCSWGMDMQENVETEEVEVSEEIELSEETYIDDPKKALKSYFEREGLDLPEYEFLEAGFGKHHCRLQLPVDDMDGNPVYADCIMTGKKKDVVVACALEACRTLDRMGELRKAAQESRKREKRKWEENDYYDSDDDTFLDRTGGIEKKRIARMKRLGKSEKETETFDSLTQKINDLEKEKAGIDQKLSEDDKIAKDCESEDLDALDSYMLSIKSGKMDPISRRKLKTRIHEIKVEIAKWQKLAKIAKPVSLK